MSSRRWHEKETILQQQAKEQKPESKKQLLGSVESEEGDRCLREEEGGIEGRGADAAVTGLARCGAWPARPPAH